MTAIAIDRFHARYRIPAATPRVQPRLQQIVADALDRAVEGALDRAGVGRDGIVCIRTLDALVRLRLREADSFLTAQVGDALADAVVAAIARPSPSFVHYSSGAHALIDMVVGVLNGDFERQWAWTQAGFWSGGQPAGVGAATAQAMRVLTAEAREAVAVLAFVARMRADRFAVLLANATPVAWTKLASAAMKAAGTPRALLASTAHHAAASPASDSSVPEVAISGALADVSPETIFVARDVITRSAIARASAAKLAELAPLSISAIATLAALEIDPMAVSRRGARAQHVLASVERDLRAASLGASSRRHATAGQADAEVESLDVRTDDERPPTVKSAHESPIELQPPGIDTIRRQSPTRCGGLLYLINIAGEIRLADRILDDERLIRRGSRWVLHQIAMRLGVDHDDPAALAFAGLLPNQPSPASLETPPDTSEVSALADLRSVLVCALRDALSRADDGDEALVRFVCERQGVVVADPGWIEVRLKLEDVSIDIRRAGLDRDPGWVPWLGVVITVRYV